ncbi:MAG: D-alanyl-D-alanine carboxypeptidase [Ruminococcaceae bacterium]|nr:D-alanyl-D-alanine carboxypeptidase [Oscillospiraceae bacterium]
MKKKILFLFAFILLFSSLLMLSVSAEEETPDTSKVENIYVYNIENDKVLYTKNQKDKIAPASTVKMMTGIIAIEHYKDRFGDTITIKKESLEGCLGKKIYLKEGENVTVEDLINATVCGGANDAANVLAYEIAGSVDAFVTMMNDKAKSIGMKNTNYTNPNGYSDASMYTTAEDTAILAKYVYQNVEFMDICSKTFYTMPKNNISKTRYVYNSNYFIGTNVETKYKNSEVKGMNAGSTVEGGGVLVTSVSKKGITNIYVMMGAQQDESNIYSYLTADKFIDWSYDSFGYKKIVDPGEMVCEMEVKLSSTVDYVVLSPDKTIEVYLPSSVDLNKDIKREIKLFEKKLEAPVGAGHVAGTMTLTYEGKVIGEVNLVTKNNVDRNGFLYLMARIESLTKSPKFKITIFCVIACVLIYSVSTVYAKSRRSKYRYKYTNKRKKK